ncbi:PAS domain S-box protein [Paenibacillus alkalitolerans]|uniref:PAS domain S-box protein n=1 Tax=Paenibacillus alkalitolerans TaxID=2799335 RepID=UPI0018F374A7|nr:PAS domain S-box protein [Paenibacillus alkalitolerans]
MNEQRFQLFFENTSDAIVMLSSDGSLMKANLAFERLVGYSKEEMGREPFKTFFNQFDDSDSSLANFKQALQGEPQRGEISLLHKDGHRIVLDMIAIPEYINDKVTGICIFCKNITEPKHAAEIFIDDTKNSHAVFDGYDKYSLIVVELMSDEELGRILNVNHLACQVLMYTKEELLARNYYELLPAGSKYVITKQIPKLFNEGHFSTRITYLDKYSNQFPVKIYARFFKPNDRKAVLLLAEKINVLDHAWMKDDIGKNLRILMAEMDISTTELAQLSGLSLTTVSNLKNGKITKPKMSTIQAIADALGISPSEICSESDYEL